MTILAKFLLSGMLFLSIGVTAQAESGSCYSATQMADAFIGKMVRDLIEKGQAFRLAGGDVYAVFENLPGAAICDLKDADLSNLDLSQVDLDPADLSEAVLCDTVLPGGAVSHRDCR
ncbi:pentapeptide repeat-containing protein [Roseibium sp.]|uniref:pentapeptide repeat-containing protein n=1 Tax=Roseibium sp. TaxID=1936156 RepID=UPI003A98696F